MTPHAHHATLDASERTTLPLGSIGRIALIAGLIIIALVWAIGGTGEGARRFYFAYLTNFAFYLSLALGGLFFVLITHVARTGATVLTRRIGEIVAASVGVMAVLAVPVVIGLLHFDLYTWVEPAKYYHGHHLHAVEGKTLWLNSEFFIARLAFYFVAWIGLAWFFLAASRRQDETGDPKLTLRMERYSAPGLILFGLTVTFAAFDLLMSLDAAWFSTIFGVYYFAGAVVGFYSLKCLLLLGSQRRGAMAQSINKHHYHDVGKMMFAFTVFWAYLAYSQYMLIWYGSIPEETGWFIFRGASTAEEHVNIWSYVILFMLFGHFVIPFLGFISRHVKRRRALLAGWAVWLLAAHWIDLLWLVMPALDLGHGGNYPANEAASITPYLGLPEIGLLVGMGAVFLGSIALIGARGHLIPVKDPRLGESLVFENV